MKITWRDTELKTHEVDLSNAVDVKINGFRITENREEHAIQISVDQQIVVEPRASNMILIKTTD